MYDVTEMEDYRLERGSSPILLQPRALVGSLERFMQAPIFACFALYIRLRADSIKTEIGVGTYRELLIWLHAIFWVT